MEEFIREYNKSVLALRSRESYILASNNWKSRVDSYFDYNQQIILDKEFDKLTLHTISEEMRVIKVLFRIGIGIGEDIKKLEGILDKLVRQSWTEGYKTLERTE